MALLRDFHSQARHSHGVFTLWVNWPTSPCPTAFCWCRSRANLSSTLLEVTSQIVSHIYSLKAESLMVMQTLAVTKSYLDITRLYKDYFVIIKFSPACTWRGRWISSTIWGCPNNCRK